MAGYKVYTVSTSAWGSRQLVDPSSASWGRTKNGSAGGFQATFKLSDPGVAAVVAVGALTPISRCVVIEFEGVVVYAGIIWESSYNRDTKTVTISYEDIWSLWELRVITADRSNSMASWKQTYSALRYDTIMKRIVQLGTEGTGRIVPMVYEEDYTGSSSRTYYGYNVDTVIDALTEIMDLSDGPDVDFRPEWDGANGLRWTLRTGDMNPDGKTVELNFSAADSAGKGLTVKSSGRERATKLYGIGEGSGVDMLVRTPGGTGAFSLERAEQAKNIKNTTELQGFAQSELNARASLIVQYGFDVNVASPVVGSLWTLKPGMTVRWYIADDPFISTGWRSSKVLKYSGDISSAWVHFEIQ